MLRRPPGCPTDGRACRALFESQAERPKYDATAGAACLAALEQMAAAAGFCEGQTPEPAACGQRVRQRARARAARVPSMTTVRPPSTGQVRCAAVTVGGAELRKCQVQLAGQEGSTPCVGTVAAGITSYDGVTGSDVAPEAYLCDRAAGAALQRQHVCAPAARGGSRAICPATARTPRSAT